MGKTVYQNRNMSAKAAAGNVPERNGLTVLIVEDDTMILECLLDLMLPDGTGYEICDSIRKHSNVPVMCLTACDDEVNTVMALEQGADDYIAKPFRIRELIARMKAVLRRAAPEAAGSAVVRAGRNDVYLQTGDRRFPGGRFWTVCGTRRATM